MATIVSVDEFVTDEWYPGFKPAFEHAPYYVEPFRTFNKEDEKRFWFLDFHWPRGLTPLGLIWNEDGYNWGTQFAAENLPLPPGRGLVSRIAGIHTYASPIDVQSPYEIGERGHPVRAYLDPEGIVEVAVRAGADAVYPGYGFLSENPALAEACAAAGITFIGPGSEVLELTGNKARAIAAASRA